MSNSPWEIDGDVAKCLLNNDYSLFIKRSEGRITMKVLDKDGNIFYTRYYTDGQLFCEQDKEPGPVK